MVQQTAPANQITFVLLEQMIKTRLEGKEDTLQQTIEAAVQICVAAVSRHVKQATLTIKLDFQPQDEGQIDIFATIETKLPKPQPMPVRLFGTKRGELFPDDPEMVHPQGMFSRPEPVPDAKTK